MQRLMRMDLAVAVSTALCTLLRARQLGSNSGTLSSEGPQQYGKACIRRGQRLSTPCADFPFFLFPLLLCTQPAELPR